MSKPCFAAIPFRALTDPQFMTSPLKLRYLGLVATHDRMGKGQGYWASATRSAKVLGCHPVVIRRYRSALVADGYLRREPMVSNPKKTVLRVNYTEEDWAAFMLEAGESVTHRGYTSEAQSVTCDPQNRNLLEVTQRESKHIEQSSKTNSAEAAPRSRGATPKGRSKIALSEDEVGDPAKVGRFKRLLDEALDNDTFPADLAEQTLDTLEEICDVYSSATGDPLGGWAYRRAQDVSAYLPEGEMP